MYTFCSILQPVFPKARFPALIFPEVDVFFLAELNFHMIIVFLRRTSASDNSPFVIRL